MKIIILLSLISMSSFSQRAQLKKYSSSLDIETKSNGRCNYNRNNLNKAHLNNIYNTDLNHSIEDISSQSINSNFSCIFLKRNLRRDSNKIDIAPEKVLSGMKDVKDTSKEITGKIRYLGIVGKKYKYNLDKKSGKTAITVKLHFKVSSAVTKDYKDALNSQPDATTDYKELLLVEMDSKLKSAEDIWKSGAGSGFDFNFIRVDTESDAHFSVNLQSDYGRGPYDKNWSLEWPNTTVAHELGHMMGLDDEYDNVLLSTISGLNALLINNKNEAAIEKTVCSEYKDQDDAQLFGYFRKLSFGSDRAAKCDKSSIMCDPYGVPQKWHIYTIFKRLYL